MPRLFNSLQGQDFGHLEIIARLWGFELVANDFKSGVRELIHYINNPENLHSIIFSLPEQAQKGFWTLIENGGKYPWDAFVRSFGLLREMGPLRRERERPFEPGNASPTETLWYRGLIGRAFFEGVHEALELVYVPDEIFQMIPKPDIMNRSKRLKPATLNECKIVIPVNDKIIDDACTLLAALRLQLPLEIAQAHFRSDLEYSVHLSPEILQSLLSTAGLVDTRTIPNPEATKQFLELDRSSSLLFLFNSWKESTSFDELRLLPSLDMEGVWKSNILHTRKCVIEILQTAGLLEQENSDQPFWTIDSFIDYVKETNPNFLRLAGDYDAWHIKKKATGEFLRGFDSWDEVEGSLIRFLIVGPLHWLGILDLAMNDIADVKDSSKIKSFRFSRWAKAILESKPPDHQEEEGGRIIVRSNGQVSIPFHSSRSARYQASRFMKWEGFSRGIYKYRITPESLEKAINEGLKLSHLTGLFQQNSVTIPPNLGKALDNWSSKNVQAKLETLFVLTVEDPKILVSLYKSNAARFLEKPLGPKSAIVKPGAIKKIVDAIMDLGYLVREGNKLNKPPE